MKKHSWVHWFLAVILSELLPKIYMFSWNTCIDLVSVVKCNSTACFKFIICNLNTDLMKDKYCNFIISKETLLGIYAICRVYITTLLNELSILWMGAKKEKAWKLKLLLIQRLYLSRLSHSHQNMHGISLIYIDAFYHDVEPITKMWSYQFEYVFCILTMLSAYIRIRCCFTSSTL